MTDVISAATMDRRGMLKAGGTATAGLAIAAPLSGLMTYQAQAATNEAGAQTEPAVSPYGPIAPVADLNTGLYLLQLPQGFSYRSFSWDGDLMNDGQRVVSSHDGMAVVQMTTGRTPEAVLIRNHERGAGARMVIPGNPAAQYDNVSLGSDHPGGGCTVLRVRNGQLVDHRNTIGGTIVNCAGGRSLWGTWLTCEETTQSLEAQGGKHHGYIFDVSADPQQTRAVPIKDMGRFSHEAVAMDPVTGYAYLTEDSRNNSGFYRFKPNNTARAYGALTQGGTLQAAKVIGVDRANLLALDGVRPSDIDRVGTTLDIEWVTITDPDADPRAYNETGSQNPDTGSRTVAGCFAEARERGALRMSRGEGIWYDGRGAFYLTDTSFGYEAGGQRRAGRGFGAVWAYRPNPSNPERGTLTLIYAAATVIGGNNPDNITVSPSGGVLFCEDGSAVVDQYGTGNRLMGLTGVGEAYILAKNNIMLSAADLARTGRTGQVSPGDYRGNEFAGATFDPTGRILFVNSQTPGITFAISGPWGRGNL